MKRLDLVQRELSPSWTSARVNFFFLKFKYFEGIWLVTELCSLLWLWRAFSCKQFKLVSLTQLTTFSLMISRMYLKTWTKRNLHSIKISKNTLRSCWTTVRWVQTKEVEWDLVPDSGVEVVTDQKRLLHCSRRLAQIWRKLRKLLVQQYCLKRQVQFLI